MLDGERRRPDEKFSPEAEWDVLLKHYPSLEGQFATARAVRPFVRTGRLQRRARRAVGPGWALLPHAAYFLDPLFRPAMHIPSLASNGWADSLRNIGAGIV